MKGYHDLTYYPTRARSRGSLLYRFDAPLFFANADVFRDRVRERIADADDAGPLGRHRRRTDHRRRHDGGRDARPAPRGARAAGITLAFAELKDPVRARLRRYGALERLPDERFFPTVGTAVSAYIESTGQAWTDWEEDPSRQA